MGTGGWVGGCMGCVGCGGVVRVRVWVGLGEGLGMIVGVGLGGRAWRGAAGCGCRCWWGCRRVWGRLMGPAWGQRPGECSQALHATQPASLSVLVSDRWVSRFRQSSCLRRLLGDAWATFEDG